MLGISLKSGKYDRFLVRMCASCIHKSRKVSKKNRTPTKYVEATIKFSARNQD